MQGMFLIAAAVTTLVTAFVHSYFGERRLIGPMVRSGNDVMARPLAKQVVRFAWHLTSVLWVEQAILLLRASVLPLTFDRVVVGCVGVFHLTVGLGDAVYTRGKHIGWPLLTTIGVLALLALM